MAKHYPYNSIYFLPLLLFFFTSCSGQVTENIPGDKITDKLPKAQGVFRNAAVSCALQDHAGNLWLGTNGEGLFRYDGGCDSGVLSRHAGGFGHFTEENGLEDHFVYSLLADKAGNIWVGTRTGLYRSDGTAFIKMSLLQRDNQNFLPYAATSKRTESPFNGVWAMMQDKKGTIWLGTDDGVYCYDGKTFSLFLDKDLINTDSLHLKAIFSFLEDKKGNIWFGSCIGEGLIRFDGKTLQRISPKGYARTQGLLEDNDGNIWFASLGKGMCRYHESSITTNFFKEKNTYDLLYIILKDQDDHLWFSEPTHNRSVCYYDGSDPYHFTEIKNMPDIKMYPVLADNAGNIWFTAEGMHLYRYDRKTFTCFSE